MKWTKDNCPFCGEDGKGWEWNTRGGQSYVKCDHSYDKQILINEKKKLIKDIAKLNTRKQEIEEMFDCAIKDET